MSCLNLLERPKAEEEEADIAIHDYPPPGDHLLTFVFWASEQQRDRFEAISAGDLVML